MATHLFKFKTFLNDFSAKDSPSYCPDVEIEYEASYDEITWSVEDIRIISVLEIAPLAEDTMSYDYIPLDRISAQDSKWIMKLAVEHAVDNVSLASQEYSFP